jgi:hypothetical protein
MGPLSEDQYRFAFVTLYNCHVPFSTMPRARSCNFYEVDLASFASQFDGSEGVTFPSSSKPLVEQAVDGEFHGEVSNSIIWEEVDPITQGATSVDHAHSFDEFPGLWIPACCLPVDDGRHSNDHFFSLHHFPLYRRRPISLQIDHYIPGVQVTMSHYDTMIVFHGTSNHFDPWRYCFVGVLEKEVIELRFRT